MVAWFAGIPLTRCRPNDGRGASLRPHHPASRHATRFFRLFHSVCCNSESRPIPSIAGHPEPPVDLSADPFDGTGSNTVTVRFARPEIDNAKVGHGLPGGAPVGLLQLGTEGPLLCTRHLHSWLHMPMQRRSGAHRTRRWGIACLACKCALNTNMRPCPPLPICTGVHGGDHQILPGRRSTHTNMHRLLYHASLYGRASKDGGWRLGECRTGWDCGA